MMLQGVLTDRSTFMCWATSNAHVGFCFTHLEANVLAAGGLLPRAKAYAAGTMWMANCHRGGWGARSAATFMPDGAVLVAAKTTSHFLIS